MTRVNFDSFIRNANLLNNLNHSFFNFTQALEEPFFSLVFRLFSLPLVLFAFLLVIWAFLPVLFAHLPVLTAYLHIVCLVVFPLYSVLRVDFDVLFLRYCPAFLLARPVVIAVLLPGLYLADEQQFKCNRCVKTYKYKSNLIRHQKYECDGIARFQCVICGKAYTQKATLRLHILTIHPGIEMPDNVMPRRYTKSISFGCPQKERPFKEFL